MKYVNELKVKIFADGADKKSMLEMYANPHIKGFTTNPSLMAKAGIADYETFALDMLAHIPDRPISFEVFSDDFTEMKNQALRIASWGKNVYAKIPLMNTQSESACELIRKLARAGVKQNVTALMTLEQVSDVVSALTEGPEAYVSIFAGRIADTGRDPLPIMIGAVEMLRPHSQLQLIWASPRELYNVMQADDIGCHIITATTDIINKLAMIGKDLTEFSLETVKVFYTDAQKAGFKLAQHAEYEELYD